MFQFIEHVFPEGSGIDSPSAEPDRTGESERWFETREDAEKFVSDHVHNAFEHGGKNEEYGYWWGRNQNREMHRFVIVEAERRRGLVAGVPNRFVA
jgi:hypothetical protein